MLSFNNACRLPVRRAPQQLLRLGAQSNREHDGSQNEWKVDHPGLWVAWGSVGGMEGAACLGAQGGALDPLTDLWTNFVSPLHVNCDKS